jgi:hypothetical protein
MAAIKLKIFVPNLANVLTLFDKIRVWRSESGALGPFVLITSNSAAAATIIGTETGGFDIFGETLQVSVDGGAAQTVLFATPNPVSVDLAISEINDQVTGLTASESSGSVVLSSGTTGTASTLEITGGTALTDLGFTLDDFENGTDAHVALQTDVENYEYDDESGDVSYYYKTQYYNQTSGASSSTSDAIQGDVGTIVPSASLIKALIDVAQGNGEPYADLRIVFYNVYSPSLQYDGYSILGRTVEATTDQAGHAEVNLIKGMILDVTFVGTGVIRRIQVPDQGTEFSLMDTVSTVDDNFQIQVPDIPDAVRRS